MADDLMILSENQITLMADYDFKIIVPSKEWIPENSEYDFEIDPQLEDVLNDDNVVVCDKADHKATQLEYGIAAASGLLTGALSILWAKELSLENAKEIGNNKVKMILVGIAKSRGFVPKTGDDDEEILRKAIVFLEKMFPSLGDQLTAGFGGGLNHHLRDFSHHPSLVGLICSILMQFTGKGYGNPPADQ